MLAPIKNILKNHRIILASGSPRRQELVRGLGLNAELLPSTFEENLNPDDFPSPKEFVTATAGGKALEVWNRVRDAKNELEASKPAVVIAADTVVVLNGKIYGKPERPDRAVEMLTELSGNTHEVYTGVVIKHSEGEVRFCETTKVSFGKLSSEQIKAYVDSGEPLDKAGGYGIQGVGGSMIERIDGDYFTVMGLPLYRLCVELCNIFEKRG